MSTATADASTEQILQAEVTTSLVPSTATEVTINARQHAFTIDEPDALGGTDLGANPVEHLLAALGSCQVITYQVWAEKLGLSIDNVDIALTGEVDLRGFFGLDAEARPGFRNIEVNVAIRGPESTERYDELIATVEKHCPVLDNLANTVPVSTSVSVN